MIALPVLVIVEEETVMTPETIVMVLPEMIETTDTTETTVVEDLTEVEIEVTDMIEIEILEEVIVILVIAMMAALSAVKKVTFLVIALMLLLEEIENVLEVVLMIVLVISAVTLVISQEIVVTVPEVLDILVNNLATPAVKRVTCHETVPRKPNVTTVGKLAIFLGNALSPLKKRELVTLVEKLATVSLTALKPNAFHPIECT